MPTVNQVEQLLDTRFFEENLRGPLQNSLPQFTGVVGLRLMAHPIEPTSNLDDILVSIYCSGPSFSVSLLYFSTFHLLVAYKSSAKILK